MPRQIMVDFPVLTLQSHHKWLILVKDSEKKIKKYCVCVLALLVENTTFFIFFLESLIQISNGHICGVTGVLKQESANNCLKNSKMDFR